MPRLKCERPPATRERQDSLKEVRWAARFDLTHNLIFESRQESALAAFVIAIIGRSSIPVEAHP